MGCNRIFLAIFLFFIFVIPNISSEITGGSITSKATSQSVGLNVSVTAVSTPTLTILNPRNETYLTNHSILLNYNSNGDSIKYNLDNSVNTTITSFIYFNTSQGSHTLYLYATSSGTTTSKNVTFNINSTRFTFTDTEFGTEEETADTDGDKKTKFTNYTFEQLQNLSNVIFRKDNAGKIKFNQAINLTDDANPDNNTINIDSYINISHNRIEIDSTNLPNFNKAATLYLDNLTFTTPRILKDGSVCSSSICTQQSYSGGTLILNVTGFSTYETDETPVSSPSSSSSSSGGGGSSSTTQDIKLDKETIKIKLKQGETNLEKLEIKNNFNKKITLNLEIIGINDFINLNKEKIEIEAGKTQTVLFDFIARESTIPDLYLGKLIIKGEGIEKEVLIVVEVESKGKLFDVKLEIPKKFSTVKPGEDLIAKIELYNLGGTKKADVLISYIIKDENNKIILSEEESVAVETRANLLKTFEIPENMNYGKYVLYVQVDYNGETASASELFNVGEYIFVKKETIFIIILIIGLISSLLQKM